MRNKNYGMYAVALAIVVVGAFAFEVPAQSLGFVAFILICPLMMFLMMRGMGGQDKKDTRTGQDDTTHHDDPLHRS